MLVTTRKTIIILLFTVFSPVSNLFAADGAYILFKEGKEATIRDGYKTLQSAMRKHAEGRAGDSHVVEINLDGNSFFIDINSIAAMCRLPCRSFQMRKEKR